MSEQAPQPNPQEQALLTQVDAAREATQDQRHLYYDGSNYRGDKKTELMDAETIQRLDAPRPSSTESLYVTYDGLPKGSSQPNVENVFATASIPERDGTKVVKERTYRADINLGSENDKSSMTVTHKDELTGDTLYEHRFKDPKTAVKFGALIAKHVAKRAEAEKK